MNKLKNKKSYSVEHKKRMSENTKNSILASTALAITLAMFVVMCSQLATANTHSFASYPKSFIPFWSQERRGYETTLLNTNQIVRIEPIFDPSADDPDHKDIVYLKVHLTDGNSITVEEGFEDFYSRVRVSQAK